MNFCTEILETGITTDKPCIDGHEPTVLLKPSSFYSNPFKSEGFIRPPVILKLSFKIPIDISHIKLEASVGERAISQFQLSTQISSELCSEREKSVALSSTETDATFGVGNFHITQSTVTFRNCQFRNYIKLPIPSQTNALDMRIRARNCLKSVDKLFIKIVRMTPTGPPALKGLEIWGQPAVQSMPSQKVYLMEQWMKYLEINRNPNSSIVPRFYNSQDVVDPVPKILEEASKIEVNKIPDEFLCPLTCEIMVLPLLLPSGNSIDSQNLEKFRLHEATWGRPPSDPFTGVPFKNGFTPVANTSLKARIDRFMILNKIDGPCARTVGSATEYTTSKGPQTSRLLGETPKKRSLEESTTSRKTPKLDVCRCGLEGTYLYKCGHLSCSICLGKQNSRKLRCNHCNIITDRKDICRSHKRSVFLQ